MKQYWSGFSTTMFSPWEKEVAEILVEMPTKISQLDCAFRLPFTWGRKGTRSAIRVTPSSSPFTHHHHQPQTKADASSSPATPLSFSPSESELDKHTLLRKNVSLKRVPIFSLSLPSYLFHQSFFFYCLFLSSSLI